MKKILLSEVQKYFEGKRISLILGLGFDQRCFSSLQKFDFNKLEKVFGILNVIRDETTAENRRKFEELTQSRGVVIGEHSKGIIDLADELSLMIDSVMASHDELIVDISAVSHELLVMLIGLMSTKGDFSRLTILYTSAEEYSYMTEPDQIWLSRGVKEIRSILGFPGHMLPSKELHLVLLVGFEVERAAELIRCFEPSVLSIGVGHKDYSVSEKHHQNNRAFFESLKRFVDEQKNSSCEVYDFEFSCVNPERTKEDLVSHINKFHQYNTVICPLNTKISTVGAALAAIENPSIQLCYAQAEEYNTSCYAKPGECVTIIEF